jgi:hypothetical protein
VVIEHFVFNADPSSGFLRFGTPPSGEFLSVLGLMTGVTVGQRDEFHFVALGCVLCRKTSGAEVAIVGMGTEGDHAHALILCAPRQH